MTLLSHKELILFLLLHFFSELPYIFIKGRLREAAVARKDEAMLLVLGQDCVAAEVAYHRSCHKTYTNVLYTKSNARSK